MILPIKREAASRTINAIRARVRGLTVDQLAGFPCPICSRPAASPYRRFNSKGEIIEGCVDAHHTGHFTEPTDSSHWHYRAQAVMLREDTAQRLSTVSPWVQP